MVILNYDQYIIDERARIYSNIRKSLFVDMVDKHLNARCKCSIKKKRCSISNSRNVVELNRLYDKEYVNELYEDGTLDFFFNIMQSITQSLRNQAGKHFETIIEGIFKRHNIDYSSQVPTQFDEHILDFTIPSMKPNESIDNFDGIIVSCKTSLRERYLQDAYLNKTIVIVTMDKKKKENTVNVDSKKMNFTRWFSEIRKTKMKVLDLFCGAGGFSHGFKKSGMELVAGIDFWKTAIDTYKRNHDHLALCRDLVTYGPEKLHNEFGIDNIDILIGGPPCQGFSNAGKRDTKDPRNSLFVEYVKYLEYYKPKAFVMENVIGILSMTTETNEKCIDVITSILEKNYSIKICKLYASDFGVPQTRRRVIIFGVRKDLNIKPTEPLPFTKKRDWIPVSSVLELKESIDPSYFLSQKALDGICRKKERMKVEGKGFGAKYLDFDKPSYTIPARYWKDGYDALVKYSDREVRRLTIKELARIQSFPDTYKFIGSKKDIIIQIGNAVACEFAMHIAIHLQNILNGRIHTKQIEDYTNMNVKELKALCKESGIRGYSRLRKKELIELLKISY